MVAASREFVNDALGDPHTSRTVSKQRPGQLPAAGSTAEARGKSEPAARSSLVACAAMISEVGGPA